MRSAEMVRFREPVEAGEESVRFRVVELRGDRVLVELQDWTGKIVPTFAYLMSELSPIGEA